MDETVVLLKARVVGTDAVLKVWAVDELVYHVVGHHLKTIATHRSGQLLAIRNAHGDLYRGPVFGKESLGYLREAIREDLDIR